MDYVERSALLDRISKFLLGGNSILVCGKGFHYDWFKEVAKPYVRNHHDGVICLKEPWDYIEVYGGGHIYFMDLGDQAQCRDIVESFDHREGPDWTFLLERKTGELMSNHRHLLLPVIASAPEGRLVLIRTGRTSE